MCVDLNDDQWQIIWQDTYERLCDRHGLDSHMRPAIVELLMSQDDWIKHAKDTGVIVKRTRKEAIAHKAKLDEEWRKSQEEADDFQYGHLCDVDMEDILR